MASKVWSVPTKRLYAAQQRGVELFIKSGVRGDAVAQIPRRFILPWGTGCGKTGAGVVALEQVFLKALSPLTFHALIVCPAIVRHHWLRTMEEFCTSSLPWLTAVIEWGRKRKLSKRADSLRCVAYNSHVQITSYDLLHEVTPYPWDMLIFDELHHLAQPLSKQSQAAERIFKDNPEADVLGLSATLIPTEVKQLWNPLRLMFGVQKWGKPARNGDVSWDFMMRYCNIERNEYGTRGYGLNSENEAELRDRLAHVTYPLALEDIRADMPPLDAHVYQLPRTSGRNSQTALSAQLLEWHDALPEDVTHRVIMMRHRELAKGIAQTLGNKNRNRELGKIIYIDGSVHPTGRTLLLETAALAASCTLVCTWDSLSEGVRLMWAQQVAIAQWPQAPGKLAQLLGRFNSVGSNARPQVHLMCPPDSYGAAVTLLNRIQAVMNTLGTSRASDEMRNLISSTTQHETTADEWSALFETQGDDAWDNDDCEGGHE